jgi:hypothetical protein
MGVLENYCKPKFNSIIISKTSIDSLKNYPELKCLFLYFIINTKQYKKNVLLFYVIINLIFGGIKFTKKNSTGSLFVFKLSIKKNKMYSFLRSFVSFYLPLLNSSENVYKQTIVSFKQKSATSLCFYRFNYFAFPAILELDLLYEDFELLYDFITNFKLQFDMVVKHPKNGFNVGEILLRMYRFPCSAKLKICV